MLNELYTHINLQRTKHRIIQFEAKYKHTTFKSETIKTINNSGKCCHGSIKSVSALQQYNLLK